MPALDSGALLGLRLASHLLIELGKGRPAGWSGQRGRPLFPGWRSYSTQQEAMTAHDALDISSPEAYAELTFTDHPIWDRDQPRYA